MKKKYIEPSIHVRKMHTRHILCCSVQEMRVSGLNDRFNYDSNQGDGSDAW